MKVIVIIPAAGLGTRMAPMPSALDAKTRKPHPSKQFTELAGTPILIHTLRRFADVDAVSEIWIALRENEIEGFRERLSKEAGDVLKHKKIELVVGGEHRQQSVEQALNALSAAPDDVVLVHDAVRPLVTPEIIHEVIEAAKKYGAAIAGLPAVDTIKQVERTAEGAIIKSTIPRAGVVLAQTPQGFQYSVIKKIFDEAAADGFMGHRRSLFGRALRTRSRCSDGLAPKHQDHHPRRPGAGGVLPAHLGRASATALTIHAEDQPQTTNDPRRLRLRFARVPSRNSVEDWRNQPAA